MPRIRRATPADASAIARVYVDTWRSIYAGLVPDHALVGMSPVRMARTWARELASRRAGHEVLAAEAGTRDVVGFTSFGPARDRRLGCAGEIYTLYVLDDHQGSGIGRTLLGAAFRALIEAGMTSTLIWVLADNPARFFYEAMGGRRIAERDERLWGTMLHEAAYGWPDLGDALVRRFPPAAAPGGDGRRPPRLGEGG